MVAVSVDQGELGGTPEPAVLRLHASDGQVLVAWGPALVYRYEAEDLGMRNLAIVALTDAGRRVDEVAAVFGLTATYVSMLRGRARLKGSAAPYQPRRALQSGPSPQHRHVRRGQPEHRRDLVDPPARVGQRHDRQVTHPQVFGVVAVDQRTAPGHQNLPIAGVQAQNLRFRHALQLPLTHGYSLPYLN